MIAKLVLDVQIVLVFEDAKTGVAATLFTESTLVSLKPQDKVMVAVNVPPVVASGKNETLFPFADKLVCVHPLGGCQLIWYVVVLALKTLEHRTPEQVYVFRL